MTRRVMALATPRIHHDALDWVRRVVANGGSCSQSTLRAVSTFCDAIDRAGIRDRFYRLNLFCGNPDGELAAVRTPLFRGPSLTGTQYGGTTDTNVNFVVGDYAETGASGGLKGDGTNRHLLTGVAHNTLPQNDSHLSSYEVQRAGGTFRISIGSRASSNVNQFLLATWSSTSLYSFLGYDNASSLSVSSSDGGHYVGNITGTTSSALYRNGGGKQTTTVTTRTPGSEAIVVFGLNTGGTIASRTDARLAGYSFGLSFPSDAAVLAFSNAMQAFQASLGRSVA